MKENEYCISVPVLTTQKKIDDNGFLQHVTFDDMLVLMENKIKEYIPCSIKFSREGKSKKTVVSMISCSRVKLDRDALLVRVSAFETNNIDGYFEKDVGSRVDFKSNYKVGSSNNIFMLYPQIDGVVDKNTYYLALVYEDPSKEPGYVTQITRKILDNFKFPVRSVHRDSLLQALTETLRQSNVPKIEVSLYGHQNSEDCANEKMSRYLLMSNITKTKCDKYSNVPIGEALSLIDEPLDSQYQKRSVRYIVGKKEYRVNVETVNRVKKMGYELRETAEMVLNDKVQIVPSDYNSKKIYQDDFVIKVLGGVLSNFLKG